MLQVVTHLLSEKWGPELSGLPADAEDLFEDEVKTPSQPVDHFFVDPTLTRVHAKRRVGERSLHCPYVFLSSPVEAFQCYDRRTGQVHGLTEALWACSVLSASAFNNVITRSGVASCVDMRDYTDARRVNRSLCNCYSNVNVSATICPDQTVEELGAAMRRDFKAKLKNGLHYGFIQSLGAEAPRGCLPGIGLELSNMGPVKVHGPIADAFFRSSVSDHTGEPFLSFSTFSVIRPTSNIWRANVRYRSALIDRKDAEAVAHGSLFAMKNLPISMTVGEAVREIQKFQEQYNE
jgi:hypothetical protein